MKIRNFHMVFMVAVLLITACNQSKIQDIPSGLSFKIELKTPGNPPVCYNLDPGKNNSLNSESEIPLLISYSLSGKGERQEVSVHLTAKSDCNFLLIGAYTPGTLDYEHSEFLLPGFWYHRNERSPENAPNLKKGENWMVREDRLSAPMAGIFDTLQHKAFFVIRKDFPLHEVLMPYDFGEMILYQNSDLGSTGFGESEGKTSLFFSYPYAEMPNTYRRKLWLAPPTRAYLHLEKNESKTVSWEIHGCDVPDFSKFVETGWSYAYSELKPDPVQTDMSVDSIKQILAMYFRESYTECGSMKSSSGVELRIDKCEKRGIFEVGFVGRVLLNAFNSLEYGHEHSDTSLIKIGENIFRSYTETGFTPEGLVREWIDCEKGREADVYSLRRQSEGLIAILHYLDFEKRMDRKHPDLESQCKRLLELMISLQRADQSFPRKFGNKLEVIDPSGGSTPTVIIPLIMASAYFNEPLYLEKARQTALFLDREIIEKADYFSSTLDANCEDKEAALYTLNSYYYLWLSSSPEFKSHYLAQARKAAFFALSWYYLWDVPFAPGQMLGDLGFKTRGWGNVSVENNHVDVYVFEFTEVLQWLAEQTNDKRFAEMAEVIKTSMMCQLLPRPGYLCGIALPGYHPEVVQHTNWDYGMNGKGYYNDIFAPGWVVSSLWELLTPGRTSAMILRSVNAGTGG